MKLRIVFVSVMALALSGCGFHPLYATNDTSSGARNVFASIYVEPIEQEHVGYGLRNRLIDLLRSPNHPQDAAYNLEVSVTETREGVALQSDTTITRYDLAFVAKYELTDRKANVVTKGEESTLESFDVAQSPYASLTGQEEAEKRAIEDMAEHIRIDLSVHFAHAQR